MNKYLISIERGDLNYLEIEPLYREHYRQMRQRLKTDGVEISDYNPDLGQYFRAFQDGSLLNFVIRRSGAVVGYSNVYLFKDMHNQDFCAQEDTIFVSNEHRNGIGKTLVKFILEDLKKRDVKRVYISPVTDLRVGKIWERMGFKPIANQMIYHF